MARTPRVRVVVLNHHGGELTIRCLRSVERTEWPLGSLEVVLVDNSSGDGVASRVAAEMPGVKIVDARGNRGFAGGCNLGMVDLDRVEHVALVNNDACVEPGWLAPLVAALEADPSVGAASPKILFDSPFLDVGVTSPTHRRGLGDNRQLGVRVSGARLDGKDVWDRVQLVGGFWGSEHGSDTEGSYQWTTGQAHLRFPVPPGGPGIATLRLSADHLRTAALTSGPERTEHRVGRRVGWYQAPLAGKPFDVVNNVGCALLPGGFGADRGYFEPDNGSFDRPEEVFGWCGAAVLLSRSYLQSVGLFEERYFLYYEDLDLSWRGRAQGWRYVYVPESKVRHRHSAATVQGSRLSEHFIERNRLLTLTRNAPARLACSAATRHLLVSGSYARRDVLSPMVRGRGASAETLRRRLRAFGAFLKVLPAGLRGRQTLRARRSVGDDELMRWAVGERDPHGAR